MLLNTIQSRISQRKEHMSMILLFDNKKNTYLDGYFTNPKYFENLKDIISKEFTFKFQATGKNKELLEEISL